MKNGIINSPGRSRTCKARKKRPPVSGAYLHLDTHDLVFVKVAIPAVSKTVPAIILTAEIFYRFPRIPDEDILGCAFEVNQVFHINLLSTFSTSD